MAQPSDLLDLSNIAQRARQAIPGVQDVFGGQSAVLDSLYNRYVSPTLQGLASAATLPGDVATGKTTMEDPATQQRAIAAGGMLMSGAPEGALGAGIKAPKGIIAYHGSPYTFDKFNPAKIGEGEGSQVYGHGLYFAENEDVAKGYRDRLSAAGKTDDDQGVAERILQAVDNNRTAAIREAQTRVKWAREAAAGNSPYLAPGGLQRMESVLAYLQDPNWNPRTGSMYQVNLQADPEQFLHWDDPLEHQPTDVHERLTFNFPTEMERFQERGSRNPTGADFYAGTIFDDPVKMSARMQEAGIPGIRYWDRGSRAAREGTSNYVVFNPQIIDILKRYGIGTGAGLAALAQLADQQNNAQPPGQ